MRNEELTLKAHRNRFRFGDVGSEVPGKQLSLNPQELCLHDPLLLPFSPLSCSGHPKSGMLPTTQRGWGHHASRHHILEDTRFSLGGSGCGHSRGRLPDRKAGGQACRLGTHRSFLRCSRCPGQLLQPFRLRSTGWASPSGRKPAGRDTPADRSRGTGWREAGRAAWVAELALLQRIQSRQ